nr:glycosyltransferase [uncultured Butyrivibrio sp.]
MKFSFVIAAYNVEEYIEKCIQSILDCMTPNYEIEIIVINDGSTDDTSKIIERLVVEHSNVKLITQNNQGLSATRNNGLKEVTGEYVFFVDGDDQLANIANPKDFFDYVLKNHTDAVVFPADCVCAGKCSHFFVPPTMSDTISGVQALTYLLEEDYSFGWVVWHYAFRTAFLKDNNFVFPEGRISEDVYYTLRFLLKAESIGFYKQEAIYLYRRDNVSSISTCAKFKLVDDLTYIMENNLPVIATINDDKLKTLLYLNYQTLVIVILSHYAYYDIEQRKELKKRLNKMRIIYQTNTKYSYLYHKRESIVKLMLKLFGVDITGKLWKIKKKIVGH